MTTPLTASSRRLDKVTYAPLLLPPGDSGGALETGAAVAGLGLQPGEAAAAAVLNQQTPRRVREALTQMDAFAAAQDAPTRLALSGQLAATAADVLAGAVDAVRAQRDQLLAASVAELRVLVAAYRASRPAPAPAPAASALPLEDRLLHVERELTRISTVGSVLSRGIRTTAIVGAAALAVADLTAPGLANATPLPAAVATALGAAFAPDAYAACVWADREAVERAQKLTAIAALVLPPALRDTAVVLLLSGLPYLMDQVRRTAAIKGHLTSRQLQPLGVLHLEQLVIAPLDVARGELLYSLPLAPREKVTLSHKEWSLRQEEYSRFVQDYLQNYSERGVAEKTDIAVSSKSETEHSKTLSMSQPASPGGATLADRVDAQAGAVDVTTEKNSQEQSRRDTREVTEKASALAIRDQKISFTVSTVSGSEDFTSRLYENNRDDKVMLIDYFRRMRRWQNELYRVGVRLTYDVVLPDPGRRLRERWRAVGTIDARLAGEFQFELSPGQQSGTAGQFATQFSQALPTFAGGGAAAAFASVTNDIEKMSAQDIERVARRYGVSLPPAPNTLTGVEETKPVTEAPPPGKNAVSFALTLAIPPDYRPVRLWIGGRLATPPAALPGGGPPPEQYMVADYWTRTTTIFPDEVVVADPFTVPDGESTSSKISIDFIAYGGAIGEARAFATLVPTPEAWRKWRSQAYNLIRQGALNRWNEQRELLRQQRAALLKELTAPDTLSLRRMEREQVMFLVLEWLFPEFGQSTEVYQALAGGPKPATWQAVLEYGEYAKFVHEAIDWDQLLVLLYPYFWDRPDNHADKLYLDHPDGMHREFLRAGACRVVLAIKPGFEEDVISLLDQGAIGRLAAASRFKPVVDQVVKAQRAFAAKAAAAIGPDAEPDDAASFGTLIGRWTDWTPTSAIDMEVTLRDVL